MGKELLDMEYLYCSAERTAELSRILAGNVWDSGFVPDVIVAISRGGHVVMRYMLDCIDVEIRPMIEIQYYKRPGVTRKVPIITQKLYEDVSGKKVLIVDEVADSGKTLSPEEVRTAVLHYKIDSIVKPDYYVKKVDPLIWILYDTERLEFARLVAKSKELTTEQKYEILYERSNIPKHKLKKTLADLRKYDNIKAIV